MFLRWTRVTAGSRNVPKSPPQPKAGLVTIGGSGGNHPANKRHNIGKPGWTTLMQESMPGHEETIPTPFYHPSTEKLNQKPDTGSESSSSDSTKSIINNSNEFDMPSLDISGWPIPAAHRVTINSQRPSRSSAEVGRTWSLRGFHSSSRPGTGHGGGPAAPEMPAIAVTTDTEVAWDRELQRVLLAYSLNIGAGV